MGERQVDKNQWKERRQFKRVNISFTVMYEINSPLAVGMVLEGERKAAIAFDISEAGMGVLINYDLPISTIVTLKFAIVDLAASRIEDQYRSMELEGEVRYSLYVKEKYAYRVGIRFINISNKERKFIAKFVKAVSLKNDSQAKKTSAVKQGPALLRL